ncbi:MAG TPA: ATP-grasp ribosomal peptide maturase [Pseudonocardiaceae bacterium]|nr:ATP-grasp ribosomal peptide maturase [Pseudonocardiaceae bacterium]
MSTSTVLVVAQAHDGTADLVVDALLTRGAEVARIDTADFPGAFSLAATPDRIDSPGWLCVRGRRIDLESVCSVYRRSPARFAFPGGMSAPERRFATLESVYGLGGVLSAQPWRWIDHPSAVADATYKPRQLRVAARCGLTVPRSLVTNVGARAREFAAEVGGVLVYKSLSTGVVTEQDELRIIYTSRLTADDLDDGAISLCCHLFQEWVPKAFDVRLTVVGDRCFAVAVHAGSPEAEVDWRSRYDDLRYEVCGAPGKVRRGVRAYLREFNLTFGAFDFSVTPDGRWWFLECNPAGQWGWLAEETGLPIAEAIADELVGAE